MDNPETRPEAEGESGKASQSSDETRPFRSGALQTTYTSLSERSEDSLNELAQPGLLLSP